MKAKTKFTRLWSILLVLVMVVGMLPTVALAAEPATEKADFSTDPTAALNLLNAAKTGTEDSTWDPDTNTLTLNGVNFETTAATAVKLPDGATIVLNGENIIKSGSRDYCYGIYAEGSLTISGSGTLNVTGDTAGTYSYGIYTNNGNISVTGGTVNAYGGNADYSYGIYAKQDMNIEDGTVNAYGGEAKYSRGIEAGNDISISGGIVNTIGGKASRFISYGICAGNSLIISCGSLIAAGTSGSNNICALNMPSITLPGTPYWWRTSESDEYTQFSDSSSAYTWSVEHTYVEIRDTAPAAATTYTVTFDANGGTGEMEAATGVSGEYTLPANGFTAPARKRFKCWSVNGAEKAVGATINVTANTTVTAVWETIVTAVWETIPATSTEYDILDGANSSWTQNSDGSLSIRGSGAFSEFVGVKVDGKSVDEQYYTVKEGSTIVTLKAEYLSTLAAGPHTIQLIWKDGTASTTFNINVNNPNTGDNGGLALAAALLALSAAAIAASGFNRKRGKSSR